MNKRNLVYRRKELENIWESLKPEIVSDMERSDTERLEHRIRTIWSEARTFGVPKEMIEEFMQQRFHELRRVSG